MAKSNLNPELQQWVVARTRFRLSHAHVQMARQLGLNPTKLGKLANHRQEPWKAPLPQFIEHLYEKRFGKTRPDEVVTLEQMAERMARQKAARREARRARRAGREPQSGSAGDPTASVPDPPAVGDPAEDGRAGGQPGG